MKYKDFTDMPVWKLGMEIAEAIFILTKDLPRKEDYGLTSQMRRSALSMPSNIAEGFGRSGKNDKSRFYEYAKGSGMEIINHLIYGTRVGYFQKGITEQLSAKTRRFIHDINKIIFSIKKSHSKP